MTVTAVVSSILVLVAVTAVAVSGVLVAVLAYQRRVKARSVVMYPGVYVLVLALHCDNLTKCTPHDIHTSVYLVKALRIPTACTSSDSGVVSRDCCYIPIF